MSSHPKWENLNHSFYFHHANQPGLIIVPQLLVEDNYSTWVQSMTMALTVKNKIGFVHKSIKEPSGDEPDELQQWKRCNNLVKAWLLGLTSKEIAGSVIHCKYACQMWLDLQGRFSHVNTVKLFHIENEIHDCIQGCMTDNQEIASYMETQNEISNGFNESYATVCGNIFLLEPLPTVNKAYSLVIRHERQAEVSNGKASIQPKASVFVVKSSSSDPESEERGFRCAKCNRTNHNTNNCHAHLKCTFCGWKGHTFDYCCKRVVALKVKQGSLSKGNQVASSASDKKVTMSDFPSSQEKCKQILHMLSKKKSSMANQVGNSSTHEELSGKAFSFTYNGKMNIWILDSDATDNMVCSFDLLTH